MIKVVGVNFKEKGKIYYFLPNDLKLKKGLTVIVKTEKGLQFGICATNIIDIDERKLNSALSEVVRISTKKDYQNHKKNLLDAKEALKKCRQIIEKQKLNMYVVDANFTFDRNQLIFNFLSDNRVDFRSLAKELANIYKTRIELRQIGVRDKAKEIGGCGQCGRELCCKSFLTEFDTVSINMAKNQNISLNPNKINGACGRLLCCLKYEDECYKECSKKLPSIGKKIETKEGIGKVVSVETLKGKYKVDVPDVGIVECEVNLYEDN